MKTLEKRLSGNTFIAVLITASLLFGTAAMSEESPERNAAKIFAILPDGSTGPEGLTVGADGNVYVATFGFNQNGAVSGPGQLFVFNPEGRLLRQVGIAGSSAHLLGLAFHPLTGALLVIDFGAGKVLNVNPTTGASSVFMTVTGNSGLNGLAFDKAGNVYVSDSFQGIIWKTGPSGGAGTVWVSDPLLTTTGVPPFGANGIEFNHAGDILFVANTGNRTVLQIPVDHGTPGKTTVFVNSINGADGIAIDSHDNLWVAANQNDEIVVVSPTGKLLARLGSFEGVDDHGLPHGLLFPASPAFSNDGKFLYVTNLALDLRIFGLVQAVDSQACAQVRHFTVSRIRTNFDSLGD
ncbi:MAG TPA: NHL repeat-containing protein [Candidatus Saccharimonadales bacterium]|nr:NHL repeat-containing protein [Candidatus Saccharimonadales bacterium]